MTWTKVSDEFCDDPTMLQLCRDDRLLWVEALVYCNRVLSDGYIPMAALTRFTDHPQVIEGMSRLQDADLVEVLEGGWQIVNFTKDQRSREQVEATRAEAKERMQRWRAKRSQGKRDGVTNEVTNAVGNALPDPPRPEGRRGGETGVAASVADASSAPPAESRKAPTHAFIPAGVSDDPSRDACETCGLGRSNDCHRRAA